MTHILFVCSQNYLRSPTAEEIFADWPGVETASAGTNNDAVNPLGVELIEWADIIMVMEADHRRKLSARFKQHLKGKKVISLDIPDKYRYRDPELIKILMTAVPRHLPSRNVDGGA